MTGKTNIDYHLEKLPWVEQQVFREIYKAIGYYNSHGAQFESPTDVFYGIRKNVLTIVDAMMSSTLAFLSANDATPREADRAALVDKAELADRIAALIALRTQWSPIDRALEIIDTVLADRAAVPTEQRAAGDDLDAMLDSVHPRARVRWMSPQPDGSWAASIVWWNFPTHDHVDPEMPMDQKAIVGTGPTRIAAIQNAVQAAAGGTVESEGRE